MSSIRWITKLHSECFNDKYVTAHHAIIPTMSDFNIAQLLPDERKGV